MKWSSWITNLSDPGRDQLRDLIAGELSQEWHPTQRSRDRGVLRLRVVGRAHGRGSS